MKIDNEWLKLYNKHGTAWTPYALLIMMAVLVILGLVFAPLAIMTIAGILFFCFGVPAVSSYIKYKTKQWKKNKP